MSTYQITKNYSLFGKFKINQLYNRSSRFGYKMNTGCANCRSIHGQPTIGSSRTFLACTVKYWKLGIRYLADLVFALCTLKESEEWSSQ